ncbi:MAG: regulatory protein TetR [Nocardioides sp.]|nr:regulatory protein TetR [Nocardioides sp.]
MAEVKRQGYHSPLRTEQAARSRAAVLSAARDLFATQGYAVTTVDQVAARAGVSKPTVFNVVGNKATLFRVVRDVAMAGDDDDVSVTGRASVAAIAEADDLDGAVRAAAAHIAGLCERYHPIHRALTRADAALDELYADAERQRLMGAGHVLDRLTAHSPTRVRREQAVDLLWLLMSPDNYGRLVVERGWSLEDYRSWLAGTVKAQLF